MWARLKHFRNLVRWWPLVTSAIMLDLHVTIELNYVSYVGYPQEHSPFLIGWGFRLFFWVTLLLALFVFPRWQSFVAFLSIAYVILSLSGR
jgi:hypothetical protein